MRESYRPGEVVLVDFPHTDGIGSSLRPAVVLMDVGDDDIVIARVTRQFSGDQFDVPLNHWPAAGLLYPSFVRPQKLATYLKRLVERRLGVLSRGDWARLREAVQRIWANI